MIRSVFLTVLLCSATAVSQQDDMNVLLMQTTFLVMGPTTKPGINTFGTAFLLLRPFAAQPDATHVGGKIVLVTAAHVLEEMNGDMANIFLRTQQGEQWIVQPARFAIRRNGRPLFKRRPDADVAVMYIRLPLALTNLVTTNMLADDELLRRTGVVPGVELKILGFPFGTPSNDAGFPILRTGVIASYPLLPTAITKSLLVDFRVFKGNSGGPVYFSQPVVRGSMFVCCPPQFVMGLVSGEKSMDMPYSQFQLSIGEIVHASIIKSVIEMFPAPETPESETTVIPVEPIPVQVPHS
jgi:hypothetical protein